MSKSVTTKEIEKKLRNGIFNLIQEKNDFLLPQVIDFVKVKEWMNIQPEYQRRQVWDKKRKSQFIESLLMNVPIPPIFLFEWEYGRYEVMDGQQRLNSIISFYTNEYKLTGMKYWTELNGLNYNDFEPILKRALDRRRISAITIMTESVKSENEKLDLRRLVFERLNTGGLKLNSQEIRNCIYSGNFNDLIVKLSGNKIFTDIWGIPSHDENIKDGVISETLANNTYFKRMKDCEIVLRFFALYDPKFLKKSVKAMLDDVMLRKMNAADGEIKKLNNEFLEALSINNEIFENSLFQIIDPETKKTTVSLHLYDALMVIMHELKSKKKELILKKKQISNALDNLFSKKENYELLVNRKDNANAIIKIKDFIQPSIINLLN